MQETTNKTTNTGRDLTWLIIILFSLVWISFIHSRAYSTNDASRMATIESLVHRSTWQIDESPFGHTLDKIQVEGHFYSSKPPTLAFMGAGVYTILHDIFGLNLVWDECFPDKNPTRCRAILEPADTDWAYFALVFIFVGIPATLILAMTYRMARWRGLPNWASFCFVLVLGLGTAIFPYSTVFINHLLSAASLFMAAAILLKHSEPTPRQLIFAGLWVTLGATIDLSVGIFLLAIFSYVVVRYRQKTVYFILGALIPGLLAIFLNLQITGSPLPPQLYTRGYEFQESAFKTAEPLRLLFSPEALDGADPESYSEKRLSEGSVLTHAFRMLVGDYGLFSFYPIAIWFLYGLIRSLWADDQTTRWLARTIAGSGLLYLVYFAFRPHTFGGIVFGPRWLLNPVPVMALFAIDPIIYRPKSWLRAALVGLLGLISIISAYPGALNPWGTAYPLLRLSYASPEPRETVPVSLSGYGSFTHVNPDVRASFGVNNVPRRWFDARSGFVVPEGPAWWFFHESTPLSPLLAEPFGLAMQMTYDLHADFSGLAQAWLGTFETAVYQSQSVVPEDEAGITAVSLPATYTKDSDSMALLGYKIEQNEAVLTLITAWEIQTRKFPIGERKLFAHLLANDGTIAAQNDSFAANYETLFPGDLFFQLQEIPLNQLVPGAYWLQIGVYDPVTGSRLAADGQERLLLQRVEIAE